MHAFVYMEEVLELFSGQVATHETVDVCIEGVDTAIAGHEQLLRNFMVHILESFSLTHGYALLIKH